MMAYSRSGLMVCHSFRVVCINFLLGLQSALYYVLALALEVALAMAMAMAGLVATMLDCCCQDTMVASISAASANLLPIVFLDYQISRRRDLCTVSSCLTSGFL